MPNKQKNHKNQKSLFKSLQTSATVSNNPSHPSLSLSNPTAASSDSAQTEDGTRASSVEECLNSLRSKQARQTPLRPPPVPSVHPSLQNLLDVPESLRPKPRPSGHTLRGGQERHVPGPAAPPSWGGLASSRHAPNLAFHDQMQSVAGSTVRPPIEQEMLPGAEMPPTGTLIDVTLRSMARQWDWHLEHDVFDLRFLPVRLKELLLSYIANYSPEEMLQRSSSSLVVLFGDSEDLVKDRVDSEVAKDSASEVIRIDLSRALGTWLRRTSTLKKLLLRPQAAPPSETPKVDSPPERKAEDESNLPESWDAPGATPEKPINECPAPKLLPCMTVLRFPCLLHLSLSLSPRTTIRPEAASWASLLALVPHLSTLESLSLANWPCPTLTPHAAVVSAKITNPISTALPATPYGGTDKYTESDSDWREAGGILRKLSRYLYCLKWLDLTGCGVWFGALTGSGNNEIGHVNPGLADQVQASYPHPDWNGSWRNVEYLSLRVRRTGQNCNMPTSSMPSPPSNHDLTTTSMRRSNHSGGFSRWDVVTQDWNVEEERRLYFEKKELEKHRIFESRAREVAKTLRDSREKAKGKWIRVEM